MASQISTGNQGEKAEYYGCSRPRAEAERRLRLVVNCELGASALHPSLRVAALHRALEGVSRVAGRGAIG